MIARLGRGVGVLDLREDFRGSPDFLRMWPSTEGDGLRIMAVSAVRAGSSDAKEGEVSKGGKI